MKRTKKLAKRIQILMKNKHLFFGGFLGWLLHNRSIANLKDMYITIIEIMTMKLFLAYAINYGMKAIVVIV